MNAGMATAMHYEKNLWAAATRAAADPVQDRNSKGR